MVKHIFRYESAPAATTHLEEWKSTVNSQFVNQEGAKTNPLHCSYFGVWVSIDEDKKWDWKRRDRCAMGETGRLRLADLQVALSMFILLNFV